MAKPTKYINKHGKKRWRPTSNHGTFLAYNTFTKLWVYEGGAHRERNPVLYRSYYWAWFLGYLQDRKRYRKEDRESYRMEV